MQKWDERAVLVVVLALQPACRAAQAEKKPLPEPPYRAVNGKLAVRPDLLATLSFEKVTSSEERARLSAFGRATFAAGGYYAVRAPGESFVEQVLVPVGEQVKAGQPLAYLRSVEVARLRAEARRLGVLLEADEEAMKRLESVAAQGAATPREVAELKARLAGTRAELAGVRGALGAMKAGRGGGDRVELVAAQDGQVLARSITPGERIPADASEPAFLVGDPSRLVIKGAFPERDAPFLKKGEGCWFNAPALGPELFEGEVSQVLRAVDTRTQTVEMHCAPRRAEPRLAADMAVRVEVGTGGGPVLMIPRGAALLRKDDRVAFVKAGEGLLERRVVKVGAVLGERLQVLGGLEVGEEVASKNVILLDGELDEVL